MESRSLRHTLYQGALKHGSHAQLGRDIEILKRGSADAEADQNRLIQEHLNKGLAVVGHWPRGLENLDTIYDPIADSLSGKATREEILRSQSGNAITADVVQAYLRRSNTKEEHIEPCVGKLESLLGKIKGIVVSVGGGV